MAAMSFQILFLPFFFISSSFPYTLIETLSQASPINMRQRSALSSSVVCKHQQSTLVDRSTQLICISYIYLYLYVNIQIQNTYQGNLLHHLMLINHHWPVHHGFHFQMWTRGGRANVEFCHPYLHHHCPLVQSMWKNRGGRANVELERQEPILARPQCFRFPNDDTDEDPGILMNNDFL